MKANGFRLIVYRAILLVLLSLYFILVFGQVPDSSNYFQQVNYTTTKQQSLPKLLSFDGVSSDKQVKLNWTFETTAGLDACILERADKSNDFKPIAYFFMTEDIDIPSLKYTDKVPRDATYSYRLRLTGKDGSSDSSRIVIIKISGDQKTHRLAKN
ncbi:MAG TPA: hypothetical protein VGQ53_21480 [Chitinophagaceae bacterium]|jgi:hypothetical protein|nr:hypothetical protein [Chitinophagaceae bacterium]